MNNPLPNEYVNSVNNQVTPQGVDAQKIENVLMVSHLIRKL